MSCGEQQPMSARNGDNLLVVAVKKRHLPKSVLKLSKSSRSKFGRLFSHRPSKRSSTNTRTPSAPPDERRPSKSSSEEKNRPPSPLHPRKVRISADNLLLTLTIISVILGIVLGFGLRLLPGTLTSRELRELKFIGEIFVRTLKMLVIPLVACSLISSLASLKARTAGRLGLLTIIYYLVTTLIAVITGIMLVTSIKPGSIADARKPFETAKFDDMKCKGSTTMDTILDLIKNMFPDNLFSATIYTERTCNKFIQHGAHNETRPITYDLYQHLLVSNSTNRSVLEEVVDFDHKRGMNVLGLIIFFIFFGIMVNRMGPEGEPVAKFFSACEGAVMGMVKLVIWFSPLGILFLIAHEIVQMENFTAEVEALGLYMLTVVVGLLIHGCVWLPVLCFAVGRQNPLRFAYGMLQALCTALGTASSAATMPLAIKCLEENNKIPAKVARFMVPLGATINMDGTALYEAVAAIYIAQTVRMELSVGSVIIVSLTATLASIGAAGIPQAGLVTMFMVLTAVGLPARSFILVIPVDWFLDRLRTVVNVWGDCVGAAVVSRLCKQELDDEEAEKVELESLPKIIEKLPHATVTDESDITAEKVNLKSNRSSYVVPFDQLSTRQSFDSIDRPILKEVDISTTPCDDSLESVAEGDAQGGAQLEVLKRGSENFQVEDFLQHGGHHAFHSDGDVTKGADAGGGHRLSASGYALRVLQPDHSVKL